MHADVIVIGSGVAGLSVALAAAPRRVLLLSAGRWALDGASGWAQGGIAVAWSDTDSVESHVEDTFRAGAGLGNRAVIQQICAAAPEAIRWLDALGCRFDRNAGQLHLAREAAHTQARVVHAGGDGTGAEVMRTLKQAVSTNPAIEIHEGVRAQALLQDEQGRVAGVRCIDQAGRAYVFRAPVCVLATGGVGQLFAYTTNPPSAQGQGLSLALEVGAELADLEFVQFHPTALRPMSSPDRVAASALPLLSEALRGAGAVLVDASGAPIMQGVAGGDLAARDVVARAVYAADLRGGAWLDARDAIGSTFPQRFPAAFACCMQQGIDPRVQAIPVVPAAHYHMGGVRTDSDGWSTVAGLAAVGEVACTGLHGANRLASNSLLEGLVMGRHLGEQLRGMSLPRVATLRPSRWPHSGDTTHSAEIGWPWRQRMWRCVGLRRNANDLQSGLQALQSSAAACTAGRAPMQLMKHMLQAALRRTASVGAHWRDDAEAVGVASQQRVA
ncbi:MAG: FAD-dependent oxidoreductase [Lysobacteraceae bacterium]